MHKTNFCCSLIELYYKYFLNKRAVNAFIKVYFACALILGSNNKILKREKLLSN